MGLPDGRKSFKIGLTILIQYRRVTDTQQASHVAVAYIALPFHSIHVFISKMSIWCK